MMGRPKMDATQVSIGCGCWGCLVLLLVALYLVVSLLGVTSS